MGCVPPDAPGGVHRGREAVRAVLQETLTIWNLRFEVQRVVPWADGVVVLLGAEGWSGRAIAKGYPAA
jgi:ketosteroid isomerase-like protein